VNQVTVRRVNLDTVESGPFRIPRGDSELFYQPMDFIDRQFMRYFLVPRTRNRGAGNRPDSPVDVMICLTACMIYLAEDFGAVLVDRVGELPVAGDLVFVIKARDCRVSRRILIDTVILGYD